MAPSSTITALATVQRSLFWRLRNIRSQDRKQVLTGRNNNQATRFVESGPLQGDVIVDNPTENAPYTYWIEVYRAEDSGQYDRILRYRGLTHYGDGNPLAVADSEMPEILHRLGLWQTGDPLPVPALLPQNCRHLFMRNSEEWCK